MRLNFQHLSCGGVLTVFLLLGAASVAAQGGSIQGRVTLPSGAPLDEVMRISLQSLRGIKSTIFTDNQGNFEFSALNAGIYEVVVEVDAARFEPASARGEVFKASTTTINISLVDKKGTKSKDAKSSFSAGEFDPAIPARARQEFERASSLGKEGKTDEAITHLRQAIAIYPRYLMAHNDLGTLLLGQGKLDEASEELHRAIEIDPKSFNPNLNLGIVLVLQHKFSEAVAILKVAVSLDSSSPAARLYNGIALEGLEDFAEAEKELKSAYELGGSAYATALFHLGQVYMNTGDRQKAISAFERYLKDAPNARNVEQVKTLLSTLR